MREGPQLIQAVFVDILPSCKGYYSKKKSKKIRADAASFKSYEFVHFPIEAVTSDCSTNPCNAVTKRFQGRNFFLITALVLYHFQHKICVREL